MKLYWPESRDQIDWVGYNHAVVLSRKALLPHIVDDPRDADYRVYCNLPWYHDPAGLKADGLPILAYTMYEATSLPATWRDFLNDHVDIVVVPSEWCREQFEKSGVKRPVRVMSLGYDDDKISAVPKKQDLDRYVYIWQGVALDMGGRKGVDVVLKAFKELRKDGMIGSDTRLILKVRPHKDSNVVLDNLQSPDGVIYIQEDLTREQMATLYERVDCCVNPTHGEGFGLIPLEQMAMGKPVLVTNWSMPYVNEQYCIPLEYELRKSPITWNHKFIMATLNGIAWNLGGLCGEIAWMPGRIQPRADGKRIELLPPGFKQPDLSRSTKFRNRIMNNLAALQQRFRLFHLPSRKSIGVQLEHPGFDAHVDMGCLKNKMVWCYEHKAQAEDLGFMAAQYVSRFWTLNRMRNEYESLSVEIDNLKQRGVL